MKKIYTLLAMVLTVVITQAQVTFFDDFESYIPGQFLGVASSDWTTWNNLPGSAEDVTISNNQSFSGSNSIYFTSTASTGGPQDVVLPFGQAYNNGIFRISSMMYITTGKNAYFNLQANTTIGQVWALDFNAVNGVIIVSEGGTTATTGSYTPEEWFKWEIVANLTTNYWQLYVNDVLAGGFSNGANQLASLDLFPVQNSAYWVDDVAFSWEAFAAPALNANAAQIKYVGALTGIGYKPEAVVKNTGVLNITSFDVEISHDGNSYSQSITGISLAPGAKYAAPFDDEIFLAAGAQQVQLTVSNINGGDDDYTDDNVYNLNTMVAQMATGKRAVVEEGTGTWCQFCTRGMVLMARLQKTYGDFFIGIAVHNNDPMMNDVYNTGLALNAFPSGKVDRGPQISDTELGAGYLTRMILAPKANINVGAQYNESTRLLEVVVDAEFIEAVTGNYKLGFILVEDAVTGTGSGYNQVNFYSGANIDLDGYENLPNPVPASMMVYDHVARIIMPTFGGATGIIPNTVNAGETYGLNFSLTLPTTWDVDNVKLVGVLYAPNNRIDNAFKASLEDAIDIGWYDSGTTIVSTNKLPEPDAAIKIYPNPSTDVSYLTLDLKSAERVSVEIFTVDGKQVASRDYGVLSGASTLTLNTGDFEQGMYLVKITIGNSQKVEKLLVD